MTVKIIILGFILFSAFFLVSIPNVYANVEFRDVQICDIGSFSVVRQTVIICSDFTTPVDEPKGGAGGVGTLLSLTTPDAPIPTELSITLTENTHALQLGDVSPDQVINVAWNSDKDLVVNSISYESLPFNLKVQDTPFILKGDPDGSSTGQIFYSIQVPVKECVDIQTDDCAYLANYAIPLAVEFEHDGEIFPRRTGILVSLGITSPIITYLATVVIGSIIVGLMIVLMTADKKRKSGKREQLTDGHSYKTKKKFSIRKPKYEPIERRVIAEDSSKKLKPRFSIKNLKNKSTKRKIRFER